MCCVYLAQKQQIVHRLGYCFSNSSRKRRWDALDGLIREAVCTCSLHALHRAMSIIATIANRCLISYIKTNFAPKRHPSGRVRFDAASEEGTELYRVTIPCSGSCVLDDVSSRSGYLKFEWVPELNFGRTHMYRSTLRRSRNPPTREETTQRHGVSTIV